MRNFSSKDNLMGLVFLGMSFFFFLIKFFQYSDFTDEMAKTLKDLMCFSHMSDSSSDFEKSKC